MVMLPSLFVTCLVLPMVVGLDNGLARTPPMGWLHWERFRCITDCKKFPNECVNEKLFKDMTDLIVSEGYKDLGYNYVCIDDCWLAKERDASGRLQPDPARFPGGIKALADYIHSKGLKFGIYADFGTQTCAGYPGTAYYSEMDAQTFADWGVDLLKLDACWSSPKVHDDEFIAMGFWLNKTGRPMLYSCAWPKYQISSGMKPNYAKVARYCNIFRNYLDIHDSWESTVGIIEYYGKNKDNFAAIAAPGAFNDPDELIIGNYGLSYYQQRSQMALWSIMAAPLLMSVNLRNIRPESKAILQSKGAIAINQDPLGKQGTRIKLMAGEGHGQNYMDVRNGNMSGDGIWKKTLGGGPPPDPPFLEVWTKPILPKGSFAIIYFNRGGPHEGGPAMVSMKLSEMGLTNPAGYKITEVFDGTAVGSLKPTQVLSSMVNPYDVFFVKAVVMK